MSTERAVTKAVNDCIEQGIERGIPVGKNINIIVLVQKKLTKGKSLDAIADELEATVEEIKPIYDAVIKHPLDTEPKEIIAHL